MFNSRILAGFECGHLGWNGHDLLLGTGHVPDARMGQHYRQVQGLGIRAARDGLPWRHGVAERMAAAKAAQMQVIWDLDHYPDPDGYAERVALAAYVVNGEAPLWVCPVNEPSIVPMMCAGKDCDDAVALGRGMVAALRRHHHDVRVLTTDAIVHPSGGSWGPTEQLADLTPENGGTGDFAQDLNTLTGGTRPRQPGDKAPLDSLVGPNGIFGRPQNSTGGKSTDIPANGNKPHETLHYP